MNRREFIQCAALLAAGGALANAPWTLSAEQQQFLTARADYVDSKPLTLFSDKQRAAVNAAAEQIIPATDTPGAIDAGAPRFVELMAADWFSDSERAIFMAGLDELLQRSGGDFAALDNASQRELLEALEDEASGSDWYQLGNVLGMWDENAPFIGQLKELTVLGFMLSSAAREGFLRANPMGSFDGDIPLGKDDAAYAPLLPLKLMARN